MLEFETDFEWDAKKAATNLRKHGVSFEIVRLAFADPNAIVDGELRWLIIGIVPGRSTMLSVAHLWRESDLRSTIRIISARRATRSERRIYEDQIGKIND